jgi:multisubunit Na+/H+ antiporter MnhC subunit
MNQYQIVIVLLLISQGVTLFLLGMACRERNKWQAAWTRDSAELLLWKRNGIMRDPKTGKYRKRGTS